MKKLLLALTVLTVSLFPSLAQLETGVVYYDIEVSTNSSNPQMSMVAEMMEGSTSTMYFDGEKSRFELDLGQVMEQIIVVNKSENPQMLTIMDGMMGKYAIPIADIDKLNEENEEKLPQMDTEETSETKDILGYKCIKVIVTHENGQQMDYWCTKEIPKISRGKDNIDLPGFPLEFSTSENKMNMKFTATEIKTKLPKNKKGGWFSTKTPKGFKEISKEDLEKMTPQR